LLPVLMTSETSAVSGTASGSVVVSGFDTVDDVVPRQVMRHAGAPPSCRCRGGRGVPDGVGLGVLLATGPSTDAAGELAGRSDNSSSGVP
jgi:hypothetical protein